MSATRSAGIATSGSPVETATASRDALLRTIAAAQIAGIRAVLLHAMSDDAKRFYARAGFHECPVDPMMMMITLAEVEKNLSPPSAS
jgi:hypothetical protein